LAAVIIVLNKYEANLVIYIKLKEAKLGILLAFDAKELLNEKKIKKCLQY